MNDVVGEQIDFAALVQNIPDSLVVVDFAINLVFVNQAGVELLGWKARGTDHAGAGRAGGE